MFLVGHLRNSNLATGKPIYTGPRQAFVTIYRTEGVRAFYKGLGPNLGMKYVSPHCSDVASGLLYVPFICIPFLPSRNRERKVGRQAPSWSSVMTYLCVPRSLRDIIVP